VELMRKLFLAVAALLLTSPAWAQPGPPPPAPMQQWNAGPVYSIDGGSAAAGVLTITDSGRPIEHNVALPASMPAGTLEIAPVLSLGLVITSCRINNPGAVAVTATWMDGIVTICTVSATANVATAAPSGSSYTVAVGHTITLITTGVPASNGSATLYGTYQ
jgi:hypothetical protein